MRTHQFNPEIAYGITKTAGLFACRRYRKIHNIFASVGIMYNHESPLRGPGFVSKKIATGAACIKRGCQRKIVLGGLDVSVDWGYAPDYVDAMYRVLQLDSSDDYILAVDFTEMVHWLVRHELDELLKFA